MPRLLALVYPAAAMACALVTQYVFNLAPCEMCWWQRYAHIAALAAAIGAFAFPAGAGRLCLWLAILGIAISGVIGGYHAGVEYHWWQGFTTCATTHLTGDPLEAIMNKPLIRCDVPAWTGFGISMAGYNCLVSLAVAALIAVLAWRERYWA